MIETLSHFSALWASLPDWFAALTGVVTAASAVTALTPTPHDDRFVSKAYRILEIVALNIGHAKDRH